MSESISRIPYYFEVLPSRLPIEQFQSLTGYSLKLCERNNVQTQAAFKYVFSLSTSHFDNFPRSDFGDMPRVANISHATLRSLTYYHLLSKFGKSSSLFHMRRFLADSISQYLRYCSKCLAIEGSHFLYQQFLCLTCCPEHGTGLIDFCPDCQTHIRFFQEPFSLFRCTNCGYDLRNSAPSLASQAEIDDARALVINLKRLLGPNSFCESEGYIKQLGQTLADYRRYIRYSTEDILVDLKLRYKVIQAIESGKISRANVTFSHYQAYLTALGLSFQQVFENTI